MTRNEKKTRKLAMVVKLWKNYSSKERKRKDMKNKKKGERRG